MIEAGFWHKPDIYQFIQKPANKKK